MARKSATYAFYLAIFALFGGDCRVQAASPSSLSSNPNACALEPQAQVSDACASYADLDTLNTRLHPYIRNLANNTDFFAYYRLNLYNKECPFWSDENGLCGNIACAVMTLDNEADVPEIWRAEELSKLEGPKAQHPGRRQQRERPRPLLGELGEGVGESCVVEYDDECDERDYCVPEDESASAKGDYVSLAENPERFTGYSGEGAHQVWEAIYRENCFSRPVTAGDRNRSTAVPGLSSASLPGLSQNQAQAALDFRKVVKAHEREEARQSGMGEDAFLELEADECLEKRVFYRVISGMHASISTHLCHDYLNQTTGEWGPNLQCYKDRLHAHPDRISNLYFNYALVLRAVGKLRDFVQDYTFCSGDTIQDARTKEMVQRLAGAIPAGAQDIFDESVMFRDTTADGISLKEDFRNRFRNVSRIMDCVGCDKCRLWGKIQTAGFGTALKVLFEFDGRGGDEQGEPPLRRTELVALVNTLDKISAALKALGRFREMMGVVDELAVGGEQPSRQHSTLKQPAVQSPSEKTHSNFDELDELDDLDEPSSSSSLAGQQEQESLADAFRQEFGLVFRAWIYVLRSWASLPKKTGTILYAEASRLWDFWLGKPMRPRSWEIHFPTREEVFRDEI